MELLTIKNLSFAYPDGKNVLSDISLTVNKGDFITLCGKSGSAKTTFLRQLKPLIAPVGTRSGTILYKDRDITELTDEEQSRKIGFVFQNPDDQIVTDKVWRELAFGLENMGMSSGEIRERTAELASFFGMASWFYKSISELSGGQKQLLNLASVMIMQPEIIILDEPTAQLDPIAAKTFFQTLARINSETDTTVIISEHRTEEVFPISNRVVAMDNGKIIADSTPQRVHKFLARTDLEKALPAAVRIFMNVQDKESSPVTVREGRAWLDGYAKTHSFNEITKEPEPGFYSDAVVMKNVCFRYDKNGADILKNLSCSIKSGEIFAVTGANGSGKSTMMSVLAGTKEPYAGKVKINGKAGYLPQEVTALFVKNTVYDELCEVSRDAEKISRVSALCEVFELWDKHPYDLSGGEQQRAAMAKVLLKDPEILILDEPTKGMDACFKEQFADILKNLKKTVIIVSHDIEFCAKYADRCAMLFAGEIISVCEPRAFFSKKEFYTTAANRIAKDIIPNAVLTEDVIYACTGKREEKRTVSAPTPKLPTQKKREKSKVNIVSGCILAAVFTLVSTLSFFSENVKGILQLISGAAAVLCFVPKTRLKTMEQGAVKKKPEPITIIIALAALAAVFLTAVLGGRYFDNRKYYLVSMLVIFEIFIPFVILFEGQKPKAAQLVLISTMACIAVLGRAAFYMFPQFKPMAAVVVIGGICFGAQTGFLIGAVSAFVSNFFFGQGAWTPWQMIAMGMIGFLAGIVFYGRHKTKLGVCIFGFAVTLILYGFIVNTSSVLIFEPEPTIEMFIASYVAGFPFDLLHSVSTAVFLWLFGAPMIGKIERVKMKYGI